MKGASLSRNRLTELPAKAMEFQVTRLLGCRPGTARRSLTTRRHRTAGAAGIPAKPGAGPGARLRRPHSPATGTALPGAGGAAARPSARPPRHLAGSSVRSARPGRAGAAAPLPTGPWAAPSCGPCEGRLAEAAAPAPPRAGGSWRCRPVLPGWSASEAGGRRPRKGRVAEPRLTAPSPRFRRRGRSPSLPGAVFLQVPLNYLRYGSPLKLAARPRAGKPAAGRAERGRLRLWGQPQRRLRQPRPAPRPP